MFDEYHEKSLHTIDEQMKHISMDPQVKVIETCNEVFADSVTNSTQGTNTLERKHRLYTYGGKVWYILRNFIFPANVKLLTGWQFWIGGQPGHNVHKISK